MELNVFCFFYCCNTIMDEGLRNVCNLRRRNLHTHRIVNEGAQNLRHLKHRLLWRWQTGRLVVHNRIACSIYRGGRSLSETMDASEQLRIFCIHPSRGNVYSNCEIYQSNQQSVTSRLETFRYRDFSQFFESIGLGLQNFGLEKKSRYRSRKYLVSKKSLGIGLKNI